MDRRALTVGLIGVGRIGRLHAEHLAHRVPEAALVAVADVRLEAAQQVAERFGVPHAVTDYRAILDDPGIDAVVICSPSDTHARIISEAAAAGKHVFCEKPIDFHLDRIDAALAAVERAGVKLQIGFQRRFDPSYRRVRLAIESGEIGQPLLLHIVSRDPAPPPIEYVREYRHMGGTIFLDMTIHDFDMARFLIGSEVEEVYVRGGVMVEPAMGAEGDLDTAVVALQFANGVIGTIDNCRQAVYGYDQRVEVLGRAGAISTANHFPNSAVVSGPRQVYRDLPLHFFTERYVEAYVAEMATFVDCVLHDRPTPVGGLDGRAPVAIALAAWKSHLERRPVRVSEVEQ